MESVQGVRALLGIHGKATLADLKRLCRMEPELHLDYCPWATRPRAERDGQELYIVLPEGLSEEQEVRALLHEVAHFYTHAVNGGRQESACRGHFELNERKDEWWVERWVREWLLPRDLMLAAIGDDDELLELADGDPELLRLRRLDLMR